MIFNIFDQLKIWKICMPGRVTMCSFLCPDCEDVKEVTEKEVVKEDNITPPSSTSVRKEVTEEDLEDWLDSMIS